MSDRQLGHYELILRAGPIFPEVVLDVEYLDEHGQCIGTYGETLIAFATTWKDVAGSIRTGLQRLGLDQDPVHHISPMVDLS
jgi:hypothetical protein